MMGNRATWRQVKHRQALSLISKHACPEGEIQVYQARNVEYYHMAGTASAPFFPTFFTLFHSKKHAAKNDIPATARETR